MPRSVSVNYQSSRRIVHTCQTNCIIRPECSHNSSVCLISVIDLNTQLIGTEKKEQKLQIFMECVKMTLFCKCIQSLCVYTQLLHTKP